jgi:uncharacterized protein DUF2569/uncharacterized protein DUF4339
MNEVPNRMSELWYYAEGGETRGPLSLADLVGNLSQASDPEKVLVWRKGFENWKPVSAVSEVAGQMIRPPPLRPPPPPVVSPAEPPSKIHEPVVSDDDVGALKDFKPPLSGIAGWLILIAIGQVVGVIKLLGSLAQYYGEADPKLFQQFPVTMWGEAALNAGFVALAIYTAVLFFQKSSKFPRFFIYQWMFIIFMPLVDMVWAGLTLSLYTGRSFEEFAKFDPQTVGQSIGAMIGAAVWITYIIKSRRVANTFTK